MIGQWMGTKNDASKAICLDVDIEVDRPCMMANDQNIHTLVYRSSIIRNRPEQHKLSEGLSHARVAMKHFAIAETSEGLAARGGQKDPLGVIDFWQFSY